MKAAALAALLCLLCGVAHAQTGCDPNPNANGPPFIDGCTVPASGLNRIFGSTLINALSLGFVGDGVTDNTNAFNTMFALTGSPQVYFPPGTYALTVCPTAPWIAASSISWVGAGAGATTIRFPTNCRFTSSVFRWDGQSGVLITDLTIDLNLNFNEPSVFNNFLEIFATAGNVTGVTVQNISIINANPGLYLLAFGASGGDILAGLNVNNNYIEFANPVNNSTSSSSAIEFESGNITHPVVTNNTVIGSVIQIDGTDGVLIGNDVSGHGGAGLYTVDNNATPPQCSGWKIIANSIHDSNQTYGNTLPGFEIHCPHTLVQGNNAYNNGGAGFYDTADYVTFTANKSWSNGRGGSGSISGAAATAGFWIYPQPGDSESVGLGIVLSGNTASDYGAGTQNYGVYFCCNLIYPVTVQLDNILDGNIIAAFFLQGPPLTIENTINGGWIYRNKQTIILNAPVSSFQWTNLDILSFHEWLLACRGIRVTVDADVLVQFGYGGVTTTWLTDDTYAMAQIGVESGATVINTNLNIGMPINHSAINHISAVPAVFTVRFDDIGTGFQKQMLMQSSYVSTAAGGGTLSGFVAYSNGTYGATPFTAIRVIADSGASIQGSCVLEGRP